MRRAAALVMLLAACGGEPEGPVATTVVTRGTLVERASASGTIEPHQQVEVRSRVSGEVLEVLAAEGDRVEEGALLVRLDSTDAARELRDAQATVRRLRAELGASRASVAIAETESDDAAASRSVSERGTEMGLVSAESSRDSRRAAAVAEGNVALESARLASVRAQLESATIAVEVAEEALRRTEIRAPFAGTVLSVEVERGSIVSSALNSVSGGTALLTLADLTDLRIVGQIDEAQIASVEAGQDVSIRVDAYPSREFTGRVDRVSPLGHEDSSVIVFDVEIVVTDADRGLLRSGMSADVEIVTRRHEDVLLVPLAAIRSTGAIRAVYQPDGTPREISTGPTDGSHIVVLEGLSEGETIRASPPSEAARSGGGLFSPPRRGGPPP